MQVVNTTGTSEARTANGSSGATEYNLFFFSEIYKRKVCAGKIKDKIGKVSDLIFRSSEPYPEAVGILIEHGWGKPTEFVPWTQVSKIEDDAIFAARTDPSKPFPPFVDQPGWIMVNEHLMGKTIYDLDGRRTEVVNDVHLLSSAGRMLLVHVDTSFNGFLRKWGLGKVKWVKDHLINWKYVQPLSIEEAQTKDAVQLSITRKQIKEMPSEDVADALEELGREEQQAVLSALDSGKAAEALIDAEPRAQRQIIANLRKERAKTILQELSVPQLATLFSVLPHDHMTEMLDLLSLDEAGKIKSMMEQEEVKARSFISNEYVTVKRSRTVGESLSSVRSSGKNADALSYIFVVNDDNQLAGVVDLRDMILARDDMKVEEIMVSPPVSADDDDLREDLVAMFEKYRYRMLPIVDSKDHLLGVAYYNDIMKGS